MTIDGLYHTFQRYRTLKTHRISALPIVILMPHSACNCRCVMCDIWKDNKNLKQLTESDITDLLGALKKFGTKEVVMSGGEALLNANFFSLCRILRAQKIRITLLSTGLLLKKNAADIVQWVDNLIVSLDGDEKLHDQIRDIPGAFRRLREGIAAIRAVAPHYGITARTVIQRLNFRRWKAIIEAAREIGIDQISFLPADVSSQAFNREEVWDSERRDEVLPEESELEDFSQVVEDLITSYQDDFDNHFIAESPAKIRNIYQYYAAFYGWNVFPFKKCNAPWVSAVIEADGHVRPCFFHETIGNIRSQPLADILNSRNAMQFRKTLDMSTNPTCVKCVCSLNLSPTARLDP